MDKIKSLKKFTNKNTALLIYTPLARRYLTGFPSSLGYLFIKESETFLLVDSRYFEAAEKSVKKDIKVMLLKSLKEDTAELLKGITTIFTETEIKVSELDSFKKLFAGEVIPTAEIDKAIFEMRAFKSNYEIDCIKKAQSIAESAFNHILGVIKPGVTESFIAAELEYKMKCLGSSTPAFETIAIAGEKTSMPHGRPENREVKKGDFVTMDFGATFGGYRSDMTRTVAVGSATDEMKKVYSIVLEANLKGLETVREGIAGSAADKAARDVISAAGYGDFFGHSLGHGVGLQVHEAPSLSPKSNTLLAEGHIVTVEPGIYLPGKFGVRIEDMVVVTKNGCNNLTKAEKQFIII